MVDGELSDRASLHERLTTHLPVSGELPPLDRLPPRLLASWQRSQEYGVSVEEVEPVFTGTSQPDSLFFECGQEVLRALHRTIADEPISIMLTDADGLVLNRLCGDVDLARALDGVHLAPGFAYSERDAGTNGLGLALADRTPTIVRAEEHYALNLCTYTCAAAPVFDLASGRLEGCVNLTTWSRSSPELLLALAQSAASNTAALMLARAQGRYPRPAPRGEVFGVVPSQLEPGSGTLHALSADWTTTLTAAAEALAAGRTTLAVGEPGSGRTTLLAQAQRRNRPRSRILAARVPSAQDIDAWLSLWTPELGKPETTIIVRNVDTLPVSAAERLEERVRLARHAPLLMTATRYDKVPPPLASLVETVVHVQPLRERAEDVLPLALHLAQRARGRSVELTPGAANALRNHPWPGNVRELDTVVKDAAAHTNNIDLRHLPPELFAVTAHRLTRIETIERDELIRALTGTGATVRDAAEQLGMSRATIYRKLARYGIRIPRGNSPT